MRYQDKYEGNKQITKSPMGSAEVYVLLPAKGDFRIVNVYQLSFVYYTQMSRLQK